MSKRKPKAEPYAGDSSFTQRQRAAEVNELLYGPPKPARTLTILECTHDEVAALVSIKNMWRQRHDVEYRTAIRAWIHILRRERAQDHEWDPEVYELLGSAFHRQRWLRTKADEAALAKHRKFRRDWWRNQAKSPIFRLDRKLKTIARKRRVRT